MTADREPASIIGEFIDDAALMETGRSIGTVGSYRVAQALLTSDDPAVHAALLDALTNAGVLRESWMHRNASGGGSIHETRDLAEAERAEYHHRQGARSTFEPPMPESEGVFRRLVTVWTEVQPE